MNKMRMQVLVCTLGRKGLDKCAHMTMPQVDGVQYLVSCQSDECPVPLALQRPDVKVVFSQSRGLSNNRNAAMDAASAPIVLIGDDDLHYSADGLRAVIDAFDINPDIDVAAFRYDSDDKKLYPPTEQDIWQPLKGYYFSSIEIAFRLDTYRRAHLRFSPELGIGAPMMGSAEESVLMLAAKRSGLRGRFFPITICRHPGITTGVRKTADPAILRAEGAYIALRYGRWCFLRLFVKSWRSGAFPSGITHLLWGRKYALSHKQSLLFPKP